MPTAAPSKPVAKKLINARIDASLKKAGDAGLAAAGYTPTQAINDLWKLAAKNAEHPEKITEALRPNASSKEAKAKAAEKKRKLAAVKAGSTLFESMRVKRGIELPTTHAEQPTYEELKEMAFKERYPEYFGGKA